MIEQRGTRDRNIGRVSMKKKKLLRERPNPIPGSDWDPTIEGEKGEEKEE